MNPGKLFTNAGRYAGLNQIDFQIMPGDRVVDVGAGHRPFHSATHLIDIPQNDEQRHFQPINTTGKVFLSGPADRVLRSFPGKFFDFCYSSHTFEHIQNLPDTIEEINRTCKRGFFALPGSDFEFLTAKSHFGHSNLCRLIGGVLHIARRPPHTVIDAFGELFEAKLFEDTKFNELWEGHGCKGYRFIWEIRHYWEERIEYKVCNPYELFPQLQYFDEL